MEIAYNLAKDRRQEQFKPEDTLPFGKLRSDHVYLQQFKDGEWRPGKIVPYVKYAEEAGIAAGTRGHLYGLGLFEGAKAFMHSDGEIYTFRLEENAKRMAEGAEKLFMPPLPVSNFIQGVEALIDVDRLWYPDQDGSSFYIRADLFSSDDSLIPTLGEDGEYTFRVFLSPSGPYSPSGKNEPVKLLISDKLTRAWPGGIGNVKAVANYVHSARNKELAKEFGAADVLYVGQEGLLEEAGTMNHFHVEGGNIVVPEFTDTILPGITTQAMMELEEEIGVPVIQKKVSADDFIDNLMEGLITEAGGLGTAAVVKPVMEYVVNNTSRMHRSLKVGTGKMGPVSQKMYEVLTGMQRGKIRSPEGWTRRVPKNLEERVRAA